MHLTKEGKQLLLKDLCARLPYGVIVQYPNIFMPSEVIKSRLEEISYSLIGIDEYKININDDGISIEYVKPYLRPMSSMNEEEKKEYNQLCYNCQEQDSVDYNITELDRTQLIYVIDWLNAHHFDYRGLISIGLALEASEDMYSTKNK